MKRYILILFVILLSANSFSAQQNLAIKGGGSTLSINDNFVKQQSMNTELYANKANVSCFADAASFNACFALDWPTGGITYTAGTGITITDGVIASTVVDTDTFANWDKDYADLINKPTIPTVSTAAYNTSTWDASTSAPDQNALRDYLINFDSDGDGDFTDEAWFPTGSSMVYPGAGIPVSTGSAWGTSLTAVTTVGATGADTNVPTEQAVREAIAALPNIVFGTGLTVAEDTPSAGTDTVTVSANTYQAYDADWLGITANGAALVSAANYAAMRGLLDLEVGTDFNAYDADLTTWAGVTPGTGVATALGNNTGAVGGLPTIIASGTYTVDTAEIAANTCASAVAVTASGVATTDTIIASPNAILSTVAGFGVTTAGAVRVDVYPTSGNVNFQFCNPTGAAIDPGSVSFNWKVLR